MQDQPLIMRQAAFFFFTLETQGKEHPILSDLSKLHHNCMHGKEVCERKAQRTIAIATLMSGKSPQVSNFLLA